ncbi:hypothetical protein M5K25_016296 [Dendrobium thyrsiflorum]|uniref:DUF4283 domain-containing protein n=1 Tax=Dendrobium thyrsiflorum TaxID=117978 RepID=A0ABD0URH4_DENTH
MAAEDRRPPAIEDRLPPAASTAVAQCSSEISTRCSNGFSGVVGLSDSSDTIDRSRFYMEKPLVINEARSSECKKEIPVMGKGKEIVSDFKLKSPKILGFHKRVKESENFGPGESSSAGTKVFVNRFGSSSSNVCSNANVVGVEVPNTENKLAGSPSLANSDFNPQSDIIGKMAESDMHSVRQCLSSDLNSLDQSPLNQFPSKNPQVVPKVWGRKANIRIVNTDFDSFTTDDGFAVKLDNQFEEENTKRLQNAIVVKVFGENIPFHIICSELRRQWNHFGKFHITSLGLEWVLCSFQSSNSIKSVLSEGLWYVSGRIIELDKWSPNFSQSSLKGLTTHVWIRMLFLPLQCWDEVNIYKIASKVGIPYLIDCNMFQWGRREFARVCVRIELDKKLPFTTGKLSITGVGSGGTIFVA